MNCSGLIKALAVAGLVGFGSHAFGAFSLVAGDTFEGYDEGPFTNQLAGTCWDYTDGDLSEVTTQAVADITADIPAYTGYGASNTTQVLKLNTESQDLTFTTNTTEGYTVLVDTLVQMVGSDDGPQAIATNDFVQTAVCLDNSDTNNPTLMAYLTTGSGETASNEWVALSAEGVALKSGDWIQLKVALDYTLDQTPKVSVTVNDTVFTNAAGDTSFLAANRAKTWQKKKVAEVAFRGTGMVDNFSISEEEPVVEVATFVTRYVDEENNVIDGNLTAQEDYTIGLRSYAKTFEATPGGEGHPEYALKEVVLQDSTFNVISNFPGDTAEFDVTDPPFSDGQTYYVQGVYTMKTYTVTVNFESLGAYTPPPETNTVNYGTNFSFDLTGRVAEVDMDDVMVTNVTAGGAAFAFANPLLSGVTQDATLLLYNVDWIDPNPPADDVTFTVVGEDNAELVFTSMTIAGTTLTVEFTANGTVNQDPATLWLLYKDALVNGAEGDVAVEADVEQNGDSFGGTITIDLSLVPLPDAAFITGLSTTDPTP